MRCATMFSQEGLGFNKVISIGNKLNIDETDLLEYLATDPATDTIFMYLEDIRRGRDLIDAARRCPKPIVVMKANTSPATAEVGRGGQGRQVPPGIFVEDHRSESEFTKVAGVNPLPGAGPEAGETREEAIVLDESFGFRRCRRKVTAGDGPIVRRLRQHVVDGIGRRCKRDMKNGARVFRRR